MNRLATWVVAGTVSVGGVVYYLVREDVPTTPQPVQTHEPQPSPSQEPVCNPPAATEKRCSSTVTCDCWTSDDGCIWTKIPPVPAPGPVCDATLTCGCWEPDGPCNWLEVPAIPDPPGPKCDANLTCGCWKQDTSCSPWVEVPPIGPAPGRVCSADVTCDCWEQETSCSPWTKRPACPPSPPPGGECVPAVSAAAPCGTNWPWIKPLPAPPASTGTPFAEDPAGLPREGFGRDAKGGAGTQKIRVTVPTGTGPGSLPWAFNQRSMTHRIIEVDESLRGQQITVDNFFVKGSYYTFDANGAILKASKQNTNVIGFGAGHDVIVVDMRCDGWFHGSNPNWVPQQNSGCGYIDGDVPPAACEAWDPDCAGKPLAQRSALENAIWAHNNFKGIQDDGLSIWGGGRRISFISNFATDSFHLSTTGWKGTLTSEWLMRLWNTWMWNVASKIGERNLIYPREGAHWWDFFNNFIADWTWYQYCEEKIDPDGNGPLAPVCVKLAWNSPQGVRISGQAPNENNMGWAEENCFVGTKLGEPVKDAQGNWVRVDPNDITKGLKFDATKPNSHLSWGAAADNGGCDTAQVCAPNCDKWSGARMFGPCHPRIAQTPSHFFFNNNKGEAYEFYAPFPKDYTPPALPYPRVVKPMDWVLDSAGVLPRLPDEQAEIDRLKARFVAGECKTMVMP